jgi:hypothetical protein
VKAILLKNFKLKNIIKSIIFICVIVLFKNIIYNIICVYYIEELLTNLLNLPKNKVFNLIGFFSYSLKDILAYIATIISGILTFLIKNFLYSCIEVVEDFKLKINNNNEINNNSEQKNISPLKTVSMQRGENPGESSKQNEAGSSKSSENVLDGLDLSILTREELRDLHDTLLKEQELCDKSKELHQLGEKISIVEKEELKRDFYEYRKEKYLSTIDEDDKEKSRSSSECASFNFPFNTEQYQNKVKTYTNSKLEQELSEIEAAKVEYDKNLVPAAKEQSAIMEARQAVILTEIEERITSNNSQANSSSDPKGKRKAI